MLKKLALLLRRRPQQAPQSPLGLLPDQIQGLRDLQQVPQWADYQSALETVFQRESERLTRALPHDEYLFQCGVVQTLRSIAVLPDTILNHEKELHDRTAERERSVRSDANPATFANTPYYDLWKRNAARDSSVAGRS